MTIPTAKRIPADTGTGRRRFRPRLVATVAGVLLLGAPSLVSAFTAVIVMPPSTAQLFDVEVTAETLKPDACAGTTPLTAVLTGPSPLSGTAAFDLILGTGAAETINGGAGDDCILGGDGADVIDGGDGFDVCIATVAATFSNCEVRDPV